MLYYFSDLPFIIFLIIANLMIIIMLLSSKRRHSPPYTLRFKIKIESMNEFYDLT